jgi:bifunctional non-homologous end joining protein LigD
MATAKQESKRPNEADIKVDRFKVHLSNQNKLYFPSDKITKGDVIDYYNAIYPYIIPYIRNRPQSLRRNPGGILDEGFFQKDAPDDVPAFVKTVPVYSDSVNKTIDYIVCNNKATLLYMNNLGCIEINPWFSTTRHLDRPDYCVIDIDPSPKNTFEQVIDAALAVKEVLDRAGAVSFCKTSGATGLHVYIPLGAKYTYEEAKEFSHIIAMMACDLLPETTSLERSLGKRGPKIYMDYLQNRRGQTLACAYSLRPKPGATASAPLKWSEVKKGLHPSNFTIKTLPARLGKSGDIFGGVLGAGIHIGKCLKNLG